ncbi:MAG: SIR2 family protein [Candidatus Poribacteria bacterium]|nr:SIR2 family protein [Candidatus Poribacteria bacterium]
MQFQTKTIGHLHSLFTDGPDPIFLLGAGASYSSGIPLAGEMVEKIARWGYCKENNLSIEDPRIRRSDWYPWLEKQNWYRSDWERAQNYPYAIENILQPREDRRQFFLDILNTQVEPGEGYKCLVELMVKRCVRTVLTTNFDTILRDLSRGTRQLHHIDVFQTASDFTTISTSPQHPQLICLHGSVQHYTDKNTLAEINEELDASLVSKLLPLLRDHPLIVIGYRGAEPSVMRHLLIDNAETANGYPHGIYWCTINYGDAALDNLTPLAHSLAREIKTNFQVVSIDGFDEVMDTLLQHFHHLQPEIYQRLIPPVTEDSLSLPYDFQQLTTATLDDYDWPTMRLRLQEYCDRTGIRVPSTIDDNWIVQLLCNQRLAANVEDGNIYPTLGGYLLFAENPQHRIQTAKVIVRINGDPDWIESIFDTFTNQIEEEIEGNLWHQLNEIYALLSPINRAFLLKGGQHSKSVYPYPPDALREIVVNALVHRDYEKNEPIVVEIEQNFIRVRNPGGLVQDVIEQMPATPPNEIRYTFETKIKGGVRGIQGYRNPVVSDLFYGTGDMERAGSGLPDVWQKCDENKNEVNFGPIDDNAAFEITISRRPEAVDTITGTASSSNHFTRYASNLLEVVTLPDVIWHAGTTARKAKDVWESTEADWLPPFMAYAERLFTFENLSTSANPLYTAIDTNDIRKITIEEFINTYDEKAFVWLLNTCFFRHLEAQDLLVDKDRKRAYFPKTGEKYREITYKARVRRATRKIVKKRNNYWEHKSFWFRFERYGNVWTLLLLPSYVFTTDGKASYLSGDLTNKYSTRLQSHDYNNVVHNDLVFWAWVLSGGKHGTFALDTGPPDIKSNAVSENRIHKGNGHQILIRNNLSAVVAPVMELDEAWGIGELEKLDTSELAQLESEISQTVSQLAEEEDVNSNGNQPITYTRD